MRIASIPLDEDLRLKDLHSYDILDSDAEKEFDDLAELASQIFGCPVAAITFIDESRQWFKAMKGLEVTETTRDVSFCSHTILQDDVFMVPDTLQDERFSGNPVVTEEPHVRFYAGAPIISASGFRLGAVCVVDNRPRFPPSAQTHILRIIAQQVSRLLELRLKNKQLKEHAEARLRMEKELMQKTLLQQETERNYISKELHENIAQELAATKLYIDCIGDTDEKIKPFVRKCSDRINKMILDIRNLSNSIVPTTLKNTLLSEWLQYLALNEKDLSIHLSFRNSEVLLDENLSIALFRIIQQQIKNVKEHAGARNIFIDFAISETISLTIRDDGKGFRTENMKKGTGFSQILLWAELFNGTLDVDSCPDSGCTLSVLLPHTGVLKMQLAV